jgi:hypothetical protein
MASRRTERSIFVAILILMVVTPAKAGSRTSWNYWIPASAGMTDSFGVTLLRDHQSSFFNLRALSANSIKGTCPSEEEYYLIIAIINSARTIPFYLRLRFGNKFNG